MPIRERGGWGCGAETKTPSFYLQNTGDFSSACISAISKDFFSENVKEKTFEVINQCLSLNKKSY